MWWRLSVILLALAFQTSFPAHSTDTLRQRYGQPVSETFLVGPGIFVSATYGTSGNTCELVIGPGTKEPDPNNKMMKRWPGSDPIDDNVLQEIGNELVPKSERGDYVIGTFMNVFCLPENDCAGVKEDYQNLAIFRSNAGVKGASRYETIRWKRTECAQN
jgi:hypothetical protein